MRDLPLTSLRALAAVYETGGIRPAGRLLGIAHSAVSRHLKELQALLEAPLFQAKAARSALEFTPQGELLGRGALTAFRDLDACLSAVRESHRANSVTVGTTPSFAARWLLPRLPSFQEANPQIEVSLIVDQQRKSPLQEGSDINIRMGRRPDSGSVFPLMDDTLFPVMSPKFTPRPPVALADLSRLPLLHDRDPNAAWSLWRQQVGPAEMSVRKGPRFTSSDIVLRAAEQGLGVALARGRLVADALESGTLVRLFPAHEIKLRDAYWVIVNEMQSHRQAVRRFLGWLRESAESESSA